MITKLIVPPQRTPIHVRILAALLLLTLPPSATFAEAPLIQLGSGFGGPTPQPAAVGSPSQSGYDAKVIGFMNYVPGHTITSLTKIGVVVFHINGIDRVVAIADGGPAATVTEMTLNDQSGCWEYTFAVDPAQWPDGEHEIRFIAYPNVGIPAVLDFDYTFNSKIVGDIEVGLKIFTNANGTLHDEVRYVNPNGGSNGNNGLTPQNAMASIGAAISSIKSAQSGSLGGATVYLAEGNYPVPGDIAATGSRWFTLAGAPGTNRNNVVLNSGSFNSLPNARFRIKDLKVFGVGIGRARAIWNDACHLEGNTANFDPNQASSLQKGVALHYVSANNNNGTNYPDGIFTVAPGGKTCDHWHIFEAFQRHTLIRNVYVNNISRDVIREGRYAINALMENTGGNGTHSDFFQWFAKDIPGLDAGESPGTAENFCFVNLRVHSKIDGMQWLFRTATIENRFDRAAFVNCVAWRVPGTHYAAGAWSTRSNHVLLWNWTVVNAVSNLNTLTLDASYFKNWSIRGGSFHRMLLAGTLAQAAEIRDNHYWNSNITGNPPTEFSGGANATIGNPGYMDVNNPAEGLLPQPTSPLVTNPMARLYPADAANMPRNILTTRGARQGPLNPDDPGGDPGSGEPTDCVSGFAAWQSQPIAVATGGLAVEFDVIPQSGSMNGVTTLSDGSPSTFNDCAIFVRLNSSGHIDVRNGDAYDADTIVEYSAGDSLHFRVDANIVDHLYTVRVRPEGGDHFTTIATDYSFRATQMNVDRLDHWAAYSSVGSHQVCDFETIGDGLCPGICGGCAGDLDGDGEVGFADLAALLSMWGDCEDCTPDLDGDGIVGFTDITHLLTVIGCS